MPTVKNKKQALGVLEKVSIASIIGSVPHVMRGHLHTDGKGNKTKVEGLPKSMFNCDDTKAFLAVLSNSKSSPDAFTADKKVLKIYKNHGKVIGKSGRNGKDCKFTCLVVGIDKTEPYGKTLYPVVRPPNSGLLI